MPTAQHVTDETRYAIDWWKNRHDAGYFPAMDQHLNWRVYDEMPPWFLKLAHPNPEDTALEVGAGYGQWMHPLARLVKSVSGFDIHPSLVAKAADKLGSIPNARMVLGDGVSIPFPDRSFSLVYSISVFQHVPRATVRGYMREIARVGTGRALLHFRHADGIGEYSSDIGVNHDGDWSVGWTLEEARELVESVGWRVLDSLSSQSLIVLAAP